MSDAPDGTAIAAIIAAAGTAVATIAGGLKGLGDRDALKARVDALEALGLEALKTTLTQLRTWLENEAPKLRKDLDSVATAAVDMEKRLDRYAAEMRSGKRSANATGQQPSLPDLSASVIRDNEQERRIVELEKRAEKNSDRIEKIAEYVAAINVQLARVETHLINILDARRLRGQSPA
jgi:uncharacterized coiled-coil protein SlyX